MNSLSTDAGTLAQWPTAERVRALKRIIPRAKVQEVLRRTGHARRRYLRLPAWFMVWFVIALGLFCRDSYRGSNGNNASTSSVRHVHEQPTSST